MKRFFSLILVFVLLAGMLSFGGVFAQDAPTVEIFSQNVWIGEKIFLMYAVYSENLPDGAEVSLRIATDAEGSDAINAVYYGEETVHGKSCDIFVSAKGVAPQNIQKEFYAQAFVMKDSSTLASSSVKCYSVLEYLNERLYVSDPKTVTAVERDMDLALLDFAKKADLAINGGTSAIGSYYYVYVEGDDSATGMYTQGETVTVATDAVSDGYVWNVYDTGDEWKEALDNGSQYTVKDYSVLIVYEPAQVEELLATFEFGTDTTGTGSFSESNSEKTTYEETVGNYTLSLTGKKLFPNSYDANGKAMIKLASSSTAGSFSFTVPDNVTKVKLYVAKYKANNTKVEINGTTYTIENSSNDGAYDEIVIDTSLNKTVSFTTVSGGYRAMLNTIVFVG